MTIQEAKELLPIIQAFADGKTVQLFNGANERWEDLDEPTFDGDPSDYRIKPEPKYRPFKSQEECWQEMFKHQPFGWLKNKGGSDILIDFIYMGKEPMIVWATGDKSSYSISKIFNDYVFADGTPFGIKEE